MRLYSPTPMNGRYCDENVTLSNGVTLEKGMLVLWFNEWFHRDPENFTDPEKFDPSRWEGNEKITLDETNWVGFGNGPRSCPGSRLAVIMMKSGYRDHFLVSLHFFTSNNS